MASSSDKVLVLMSGGVDSAVAAALLKRRRRRVEGVTLLLGKLPGKGKGDEVPPQVADALRISDHLGIPHHVLDLREAFRTHVVDPFVQGYARGRTPNPCVVCNPLVKFAEPLRLADELGATHIATGHYARIGTTAEGRYFIRKGRDEAKDQSYFLYRLPQMALSRTLFPLGELTKEEVRRIASELGLPVADKEESQEACFVPAGKLHKFLKSHIPTCALKPGLVVGRDGRPLGTHDGIHCFTIGQRRGLGVAAGRPLYVLSIDAADGTVTVGDEIDLHTSSMKVTDLHWFLSPPSENPMSALVRVRYRHREAPARIWLTPSGADVIFQKPQRAITPGQSAVFYRGEVVLGGGVIRGLP